MNDKYYYKTCGRFAIHERRFVFITTPIKNNKEKAMKQNVKKYYKNVKDWDFDMFEIESETLTNWDFYEILKKISNKNSKILDLGTGGGEKVTKYFPECEEILGTDYLEEMIETANKNLKTSGRKNISFRVMDNLKMDVPENYFDIVVARHTTIDPKQIYKCLKKGGYLLIRGVEDKDDCYALKLIFGQGQGFDSTKSISLVDYENVLNAGFKEVELVPLYEREYYKNKFLFKKFLEKAPIVSDFSEEGNEIDEKLLDLYIKDNTFDGKIRLLRRYYGIVARKI